jgi:hypothetical protein
MAPWTLNPANDAINGQSPGSCLQLLRGASSIAVYRNGSRRDLSACRPKALQAPAQRVGGAEGAEDWTGWTTLRGCLVAVCNPSITRRIASVAPYERSRPFN